MFNIYYGIGLYALAVWETGLHVVVHNSVFWSAFRNFRELNSLSLKRNLYTSPNHCSKSGVVLSVIHVYHLRQYLYIRIIDRLYVSTSCNTFSLRRHIPWNMIRISFCSMGHHFN